MLRLTFSGDLTPTAIKANNFESYTFVTLSSEKYDHPPPLSYVTLELPP